MVNLDHTHAPSLVSWVANSTGHSDFPIQNLPLGVFSTNERRAGIGVAIGDDILDLRACAEAGLLSAGAAEAAQADSLNALFALPVQARQTLRFRLSNLLSNESNRSVLDHMLHRAADCTLHLPFRVGDYTDFYAGIRHAMNVGRLFRPDAPLLPNYKYVPIGYHGRASTVRPSGAQVTRPNGQTKPAAADRPAFGPCKQLDYELELGIWCASSDQLGVPIDIENASTHVGGFCLLNDWSARDIQAWEYQPLGPFLSKSFHTSVSSWVITSEALAPFRIPQLPRPTDDPRPLEYLWSDGDQQHGALSVQLEVYITSAKMRELGMPPHCLSTTQAKELYWTPAQLLAHHSSNGCTLQPGDLLGTGTISSADLSGFGSLLELTQCGSRPIILPSGEARGFLENDDEVTLTGRAHRTGRVSIGFGLCTARVKANRSS